MDGIKSEIQKYRAIVEGVRPRVEEPRSEMSLIRQLHEGAGRPAARKPRKTAPRFVLPEAARTKIEKHVDLARIMIENTDKLLESRNISQDAVTLVARRIAEGVDMTAYIRPRDKAAAILEGLTDILAAANPDFANSEVTVSAGDDAGDDWLVTATDEMVSRCRSGDACTSVINELARQYADREDGSHEAFEMARDALEKRAWEMGLKDGDACDAADAGKDASTGSQRVNFEIFTPLEVTAESRTPGKRPVMEKGYNDPDTDATKPARDERMHGGRMGDAAKGQDEAIPDENNAQQASSAPAGNPAPAAAKPQASAAPTPAKKPAAKPQPAQKSQTRIEFEKAFKAARQQGQTKFTFKGKEYNTRLKTEDDAKWKAAMAANAQKAQQAQGDKPDAAQGTQPQQQASGPSEQDVQFAGKMKDFLDKNPDHAKAIIQMMVQKLKAQGGATAPAAATGGTVPPQPGQTVTTVKPAAK